VCVCVARSRGEWSRRVPCWVAKWCGGRGRVAVAKTAVGDDAALSVFTQLAGYGAAETRGGVSRARALPDHLKLGGRSV